MTVANRWDDPIAQTHPTLLEQRVYSSRLLGQDSSLVLHGGGNTSVKSKWTDILGEVHDVLYIKGSGWDLATIQQAGFPGVKMRHLLKLRTLLRLGDVEMMRELRTQLIDPAAPDPSVETLLHAFIPHVFVDHTHADAIVTLTNQPHGAELIQSIFRGTVAIVPYVMPGFQLAKLCADIFDKNPAVQGLILLNHGIFTFGETAKQSYDRMISLVNVAEEYIQRKSQKTQTTGTANIIQSDSTTWAQQIRTCFRKRGFSCIVQTIQTSESTQFLSHPNLRIFSQRGPITPDHVIRTKRLPLLVEPPSAHDSIHSTLNTALDQYAKQYEEYFHRNQQSASLQILDPLPRVILVPGVAVFTVGKTLKDARVAADIYEHTMKVILDAEAVGQFTALSEQDIFDVEYWILEQAKLKLGASSLALSGKVVVVSGAASGIGLGIARECLQKGAVVCGLDIQSALFAERKSELLPLCRGGAAIHFFETDVTKRSMVRDSIHAIVHQLGGIDVTIVNAGMFPASAEIENIRSEDWEQSMRVNLDGAFHVVAESMHHFKKQQMGGDIVFIASKNVPAPGPKAASYSVAKAGVTQLARICALEGGSHGIRVNTLHPHLVFDTALWGNGVLESRAKAYGLTVEEYKRNNLLRTELSSSDVGKAVVALVSGDFSKTTGAQIPIDGGSDRTL